MAEKKSRSAVGYYRSRAGLPPGTLTYYDPSGSPETNIHLTIYNRSDFEFSLAEKKAAVVNKVVFRMFIVR
ncbi:MAG TPA: hypothetical protein PKH94_00450 [Bacteroidales bacterium]|nr:hypothetical protein [Bacteroidales bacterium]HNS45686.1 hypothetical protein [Bacteroidales bacterium]